MSPIDYRDNIQAALLPACVYYVLKHKCVNSASLGGHWSFFIILDLLWKMPKLITEFFKTEVLLVTMHEENFLVH